MADNRLNLTGLTYFYNKLKAVFASQTALNDLSDRVDDIVAEGGEPNVIEVVKKNGTALTPDANKAVDVSVPTVTKSGTGETEKVSIVEGRNTYDVPTVGAMEDYVSEHGGVIQKVKLAGTELAIDSSDKSVNIPVATTSADGAMSSSDKTKLDGVAAGAEENVQSNWTESDSSSDAFILNKPTKLSEFTNDGNGTTGSKYATTAEVTDAIDAKISATYKAKGSVAFANLPSLAAANEGNVYNVTDSFTTTADFVDGAGNTYPAGTNVVIINAGTEQNPVYKYDVLAGFVDLTDYWNATNLPAITTAQIDTMMAS